MRTRNPMCSSCRVTQKAANSSYCPHCRNERQRRRYSLRPMIDHSIPRARSRGSNSCNCGNPGCTGLTCDVVRL